MNPFDPIETARLAVERDRASAAQAAELEQGNTKTETLLAQLAGLLQEQAPTLDPPPQPLPSPTPQPFDPFRGKPPAERIALGGAVALATALAFKHKNASAKRKGLLPAIRRAQSKHARLCALRGWIQIDEPSARIFWHLRVPLILLPLSTRTPRRIPPATLPHGPFERFARRALDPCYFVWCEEFIAYQGKMIESLAPAPKPPSAPPLPRPLPTPR